MRYLKTLVCLVALLGAGCAAVQRQAKPELSLVNLSVTNATLFETALEVTVRVTNENPTPLAIQGGVVKIHLQGLKVGKGLFDQELELPSLGSTTITVPVYVNNLALATRLRSIVESRKLSYELRGYLYQPSSIGLRRLRSSGSGVFDFAPATETSSPESLDPPRPENQPPGSSGSGDLSGS